ncbi:MAG: cold shock domain-containing protein [Candidatus Micrarchaeota archaeon]|nr:cold shock domain-containing protein [Candidatus Micrarchaeota archaeon]
MKGKVKMFNAARSFGFITGEDGKDVYVHTSAIEGGAALAVGDAVEYEVESSERGLRAKNVKKV